MNKKWLTGLSLMGIAGTGGAAYAAVSGPSAPTATPSTTVAAAASTTAAATPATDRATAATQVARRITYQVGDAGSVNIDVDGNRLGVEGVAPAAGWSIASMSSTSAQIDVQFSDGMRMVGFSATSADGSVTVAVSNALLPGMTGPAPSELPVVSTVEVAADASSGGSAPPREGSAKTSTAPAVSSSPTAPARDGADPSTTAGRSGTPGDATVPPPPAATPVPSVTTQPSPPPISSDDHEEDGVAPSVPPAPSAAATTTTSAAGEHEDGDDVDDEHEGTDVRPGDDD